MHPTIAALTHIANVFSDPTVKRANSIYFDTDEGPNCYCAIGALCTEAARQKIIETHEKALKEMDEEGGPGDDDLNADCNVASLVVSFPDAFPGVPLFEPQFTTHPDDLEIIQKLNDSGALDDGEFLAAMRDLAAGKPIETTTWLMSVSGVPYGNQKFRVIPTEPIESLPMLHIVPVEA